MPQHFILSRMMAYFPVDYPAGSPPVYESTKVDLIDYLSRERRYRNLVLRPLMVRKDSIGPAVAHFDFLPGLRVYVVYTQAMYQVEVESAVNAFALCDAIHGAMALLDIPSRGADDDVKLLPMQFQIPQSRILYEDQLAITDFDSGVLHERVGHGAEADDLIWSIATAVVDDDVLLYSLLFLRDYARLPVHRRGSSGRA